MYARSDWASDAAAAGNRLLPGLLPLCAVTFWHFGHPAATRVDQAGKPRSQKVAPLFPKKGQDHSYNISYSPKHGRSYEDSWSVMVGEQRRRRTLISFTPSARHANLSLRRADTCVRTHAVSLGLSPSVCTMRSQYAGRVAGLIV